MLDVDNLSVKLGAETVIDKVSFCIHSSEFIGLIGPNGAGKTTLLRALLGLLETDSGKISKNTGVIGYIPQRGATHENQVPMSVLEIVSLGSKGNKALAHEALEDVKMAEFANKRFTQLSGGQQQRVFIAKALAAKPNLLILDEPTTGVDESSQAEFYQILYRLQKRAITIVMVSHDVDTVLSLVTRVICLKRGILFDGSPEHFEADQYIPNFYDAQHRRLHHKHGKTNA